MTAFASDAATAGPAAAGPAAPDVAGGSGVPTVGISDAAAAGLVRQRRDGPMFLREFLRSPTRVGAVAPSSRRLADAITSPIPERGDPIVVELGPGTGAFTAVIQSRLAGRGRHLAIELSPTMAELLASRHPGVEVITGNAADCRSFLTERDLSHATVVVSGLPWVSFPRDLQLASLDAVHDALSPDGAFTTFGYVLTRHTPPARRFRQLLHDRFEEVVVGRTVLANLPPAFVYHARRPR
ncbi:methyltransferase domain-containing protein [Solwaraspora sp. WMMD406]|uniref:class I SAM-dependent methyltransferase n=1 Tax=Solwaraspora sp. WMMD406 TaxID=3016095 RepID=UPI002416E658|nr:methyltransferase domain-containing protein [Solwaraspora sp. WMMD406]MDG4764309.1 methyltransferase domain-containing protein [Solwaraspora sp. WMMD406]